MYQMNIFEIIPDEKQLEENWINKLLKLEIYQNSNRRIREAFEKASEDD